jgi:hypothetical protein
MTLSVISFGLGRTGTEMPFPKANNREDFWSSAENDRVKHELKPL